MGNDRLNMTPQEQKDALCSAGFSRVVRLMLVGSLTLFRAAPSYARCGRPDIALVGDALYCVFE